MSGQLDALKARSLPELAAVLNLSPRPDGCTCPKCGAVVRGSEDKRPAVAFSGPVWTCRKCEAGGGAVDLACWAVAQRAAPGSGDRDGWRAVLEAFTGAGLIGDSGGPVWAGRPPAPVAPVVRAALPPADEVAALWQRGRTGSLRDVAAWLEARGLSGAAADSVRGLPTGALPEWARCKGLSWAAGWRALFAGYDENGSIVTLRARWTNFDAAPGGVKSTGGTGVATGPAVLACSRGVALLQGDEPREWDGRVVIVEGEPDWLTWTIATSKKNPDEARPAWMHRFPVVLGVWAGGWSQGHADKIPNGARVSIRTHDDPAGDKYAAAIASTLTRRCTVLRPRGNRG